MILKNFSALCLDMDFTLVNYSLTKFIPMVHNCVARYLVEEKGYDKSLLELAQSDYCLIRRGIIMDKTTHCFIDVSSSGRIISALRGKTMLSEDQISEIYPECMWPAFESYSVNFDDGNTESPYVLFDSVFISPLIPLVAKCIDKIINDHENNRNNLNRIDNKCKILYRDLFCAFTFNYFPENYKKGIGHYFPEMKKNPDLYLTKASDKFINKLKDLRNQDIKTVLITASHIDYTELLMDHVYGSDWRSLFDVVCCRARKPGFFSLSRSERPFFGWDQENKCYTSYSVSELNGENVFLEGEWTCVNDWICKNSKTEGLVAYVGDSFKSDIVPTKLHTTWKLFSVVMEGKDFKTDINMNDSDDHVNKKRRSISSETEGWGSFFGTKVHPTMFGGKLLDYSDLTLSDVEMFSKISVDQEFGDNRGNFFDFNPLI